MILQSQFTLIYLKGYNFSNFTSKLLVSLYLWLVLDAYIIHQRVEPFCVQNIIKYSLQNGDFQGKAWPKILLFLWCGIT